MTPLLVLRPEPGNAATVGRARASGFDAVSAPLFALRALAWDAPDPAAHDALMLTSANAVRLAGPALAAFRDRPVYAVGEATAAAARAAGFACVRAGSADAAALAALMAADGIVRPLHLAGRDHRAPDGSAIERRLVYAADAVAVLPRPARTALDRGGIALFHSPRAAATFAALLDAAGIARAGVAAAAISAAAAGGWPAAAIAAAPTDAALLAAAARLCDKG